MKSSAFASSSFSVIGAEKNIPKFPRSAVFQFFLGRSVQAWPWLVCLSFYSAWQQINISSYYIEWRKRYGRCEGKTARTSWYLFLYTILLALLLLCQRLMFSGVRSSISREQNVCQQWVARACFLGTHLSWGLSSAVWVYCQKSALVALSFCAFSY